MQQSFQINTHQYAGFRENVKLTSIAEFISTEGAATSM
jgi:hypothetical protein